MDRDVRNIRTRVLGENILCQYAPIKVVPIKRNFTHEEEHASRALYRKGDDAAEMHASVWNKPIWISQMLQTDMQT